MQFNLSNTLFIASVSLLFLSGCQNSQPDTEKKTAETASYKVIVKQEIPSIDASITNDVVGWGVLKNTGEGLFRLDQSSKLIPAGAADLPKISADGLTYTFPLRKTALWANGEPVTAQDYVYGWQRTVAPETASEVAYLFESLKNYQGILKGDSPVSELGVKALSDYELEVTLENPVPYIQSLFSLPPFFPQNKKMITDSGDKYATASQFVLGNGPFTLENFDGAGTDTNWSYVKNETYWDREQVKIDDIQVDVVKEDATALNLFQDGQADDIVISGEIAQQMSSDPSFISQELSTTTYIEFNHTKKELQNENLRKALTYAFDRQLLVDKILGDGSLPATGLVPKNMSFNPTTQADFITDSGNHLAFDAIKAQEYWKKAKKELNIEDFHFSLMSSDTDSAKKVVEYMQGAIQETLPEITVEVLSVPLSIRLDRETKGDFDLTLVGWGAEYDDPSVFLELFVSNNFNNSGQYRNPDFDKLIQAAGTIHASDPDARWRDLLEAEKILLETAGVAPIYQKAEAHLRNPKIKNILSAGPEFDYKWSYIEK